MADNLQTHKELQNEHGGDTLRILLIGRTGVGKSAVGNTLLGKQIFPTKCSSKSCTTDSSWFVGKEPNSSRLIKVVDTPGIMDTTRKKKDIHEEIEKGIKELSPGPHAIIIVVSPLSFTDDNQKMISEFKEVFHCDGFLQFTIIVMVRRTDIQDHEWKPKDIHTFVDEQTTDIKVLYNTCGKRIVAVENVASLSDRNQCGQEIMTAIDGLGGGYFNLTYRELERLKKCAVM